MDCTNAAGTPVDPRSHYKRHGYAIFRGVIDEELIAEGNAHVEWLQTKHPDVRPEQLDTQLVAQDPFWVRLISDSRLLDIAQLYVGSDIALFASHYISKPPYSGLPVLWHQDAAFWPIDPMRVVTLWLAIDRSTPENGCLRVIPGTHNQAIKPLRERHDIESVLSSEIAADNVDEGQAVDFVLAPGDVSVHHPNIVHGSNANRSPLRRCGLTIRYIPTTTRITARPWPSAFLLRGEAVLGVNDYSAKPKYVEGHHIPFRGSGDWR